MDKKLDVHQVTKELHLDLLGRIQKGYQSLIAEKDRDIDILKREIRELKSLLKHGDTL